MYNIAASHPEPLEDFFRIHLSAGYSEAKNQPVAILNQLITMHKHICRHEQLAVWNGRRRSKDLSAPVIFLILLCEEWHACNHKSDCTDVQTFSTALVPWQHRAHPWGCLRHSWDSVIEDYIKHPCQPGEKKHCTHTLWLLAAHSQWQADRSIW